MAVQITLLRLQRAGTIPHYTPGAATLYPGLCAAALTARTAYVTRFYITCIAISRFAQGTPVLTIRVISAFRGFLTSSPFLSHGFKEFEGFEEFEWFEGFVCSKLFVFSLSANVK